jgi:arabinose-5-phosphate isomerase
MHSGIEVPVVPMGSLVSRALLEMTKKKLGMTAVVNPENEVVGIFTDGDLRRMLENNLDVHSALIDQVMTRNCKVINADILAAEAMQIMEIMKINALLVVDAQQSLIGALNMHDLVRAGIV